MKRFILPFALVMLSGCQSTPSDRSLQSNAVTTADGATSSSYDWWVGDDGKVVDANAAANCLMLADKQLDATGNDLDKKRGQFWLVRLVELEPVAGDREKRLGALAAKHPDFAPGSRVYPALIASIQRPLERCDRAQAKFEERMNG